MDGRQDIDDLRTPTWALSKLPLGIHFQEPTPCDASLELGENGSSRLSQVSIRVLSRGQGWLSCFPRAHCTEKGVDLAIEIARRAGVPLRIAAKVDRADTDYSRLTSSPCSMRARCRIHGEIAESENSTFLGGALALLFPISWPEPFGLVMIEAMACGTPVIGFRRGSVRKSSSMA